jgi:hypothetical protein
MALSILALGISISDGSTASAAAGGSMPACQELADLELNSILAGSLPDFVFSSL